VRRRLVALTVVPVLLLGAAACGEDSGSGPDTGQTGSVDIGDKIPGLKVSGDFGKAPEVTLDEPLKNSETQSQVIIAGDGTKVAEGGTASLHIQVADRTGKKTVGTFEQGTPLTGTMNQGEIFPAVLESVVGLPVGSRVAIASTSKDAFGEQGAQQYGVGADENVLFIVDVMSVPLNGPEGTKADLPKGLPTIEEDADGDVTGFTFEDAPKKPADKLQVVPVIEGEGDPVESGDSVTFDYLGQVYGTETIFDESFSEAPRTFSVGTGNLIKAWDEGLIGVKEGSRVMIIAPPEYGYGKAGNPQAKIKGTDTLVFVVDVLGVG